jgi:GntR family transcriptional regulator of arabinose operon
MEMAEKRVLWYSTEEKGTLFSLSKERIMALIEDSTAIVCYNDELAVGLLEFCKNNNIDGPTQLSIVGIDDSKLARICDTPLTTVRHPNQRLGEKVVEVLFDLLDNPDPFYTSTEDYSFIPKLMKRASTARIK